MGIAACALQLSLPVLGTSRQPQRYRGRSASKPLSLAASSERATRDAWYPVIATVRHDGAEARARAGLLPARYGLRTRIPGSGLNTIVFNTIMCDIIMCGRPCTLSIVLVAFPTTGAPVESIAKRFGTVLRRRREAAGISQEDLAAKAELHRNYVGLLERGKQVPSILVVEKLAAALGTTISSLMRDVEKEGQ